MISVKEYSFKRILDEITDGISERITGRFSGRIPGNEFLNKSPSNTLCYN